MENPKDKWCREASARWEADMEANRRDFASLRRFTGLVEVATGALIVLITGALVWAAIRP